MSVWPTASQTRTPKGPGSSPRQRFDHSRRQSGRDRSRDAHAGLPRKLDLDRRCRRAPGVISGRRDQNLSETMADPKLSPPAINLARANLCPTSDVRDYRARRQALRNNRSFLPSAPTPPPFWACYDLNPRHRTVPNTSANTISCTSAYQPNPPQLGKAAITAGLPTRLPPRKRRGCGWEGCRRSGTECRTTSSS